MPLPNCLLEITSLMQPAGYCLHEALQRAKAAGLHWLLHLDPDELLYPSGAPAFSLPGVLGRVNGSVPAVRFMNFEGQPEAGDLVNRYEQVHWGVGWACTGYGQRLGRMLHANLPLIQLSVLVYIIIHNNTTEAKAESRLPSPPPFSRMQVTLFKTHKLYVTPEAYPYRHKYKLGSSPSLLLLYANGKSAVRVDAPGVRHLGPHFFTGEASPRWGGYAPVCVNRVRTHQEAQVVVSIPLGNEIPLVLLASMTLILAPVCIPMPMQMPMHMPLCL